MVGSASLDSDGFASYTAWNATCYNPDGNTVFNGDPACNGGASTPDVFTGPLLALQSISRRRRSHFQHARPPDWPTTWATP